MCEKEIYNYLKAKDSEEALLEELVQYFEEKFGKKISKKEQFILLSQIKYNKKIAKKYIKINKCAKIVLYLMKERTEI